jgi:AraC family transcriptional regulator
MYAERVLLASTTYFAHAFGGMRPPSHSGHGLSAREVNWAIDLMHAQFHTDLSLSILASEMDLTARQFAQAFKRTTGQMPDAWMRDHRIEQAKTMMRYSPMPIPYIATICGFASVEHFARLFSSIFDVTPEDWRRQVLN